MQTAIDTHPSFRFELEAWPVRRHGVTMAMLLFAVTALRGIDAGALDHTKAMADLESVSGRFLSTFTPLTDSTINFAADLWGYDQASAASNYGDLNQWDVADVTTMYSCKSIRIAENDLT
jgi:hypothetical protein